MPVPAVDVSPLFAPLDVRGKVLRNRLVMPPMVQLRRITGPDGVDWYRQRAAGGVGLVIVEATAVDRFGCLLTARTLRPLVEAVHGEGARIAIQLFPVTFDFPRVQPLPAPADLSLAEIAAIVDGYRRAAAICAEAGFDGVEPHGAHGYVLNQFFSPEQNRRADGYGGTQAGRERFALEIIGALRPVLDAAGMILLYRHTPVGKAYGIDESLAFLQRLVEAGVDVLDISPASDQAPGDRAAPFTALGVPVIAVNELDDVERALEVLNEGRAHLVAVGRGLIADPEWPARVRAGRFDEIQRCERCDEGCFGNLRRGIPVACAQWPG